MGCRLFERARGWAAVGAISIVWLLPLSGGSAVRAASPDSTNIESASTLDLAGLQTQFAALADRVSPSVVAISASCTPIDSDDVLKTDNLNPHRLDNLLAKTT